MIDMKNKNINRKKKAVIILIVAFTGLLLGFII